MKIALILLVLSCFTNVLAQKTKPFTYDKYCNARFEYCISYPQGLLNPQPEADNGDGRKFLSNDEQVVMLVYGQNNALDETLAGKFADETAAGAGRTVTYKLKKKNWFVVSGIENGMVFYHKTIFRNDQFLTFSIEYPKTRKKQFDPITAKISASFK
jgi:hypothetical protein